MERPELCIQNSDQLNSLQLPPLPVFRKNIRLLIDDPAIPEGTRSLWEKELNEKYEDCGCHLAGIGFAAGMLLYILWIFIGPVKLSELALSHLWYGIITTVAGLIVGKLIGYQRARKKLRQTILQIQEKWTFYSDDLSSDFMQT